MFALWTIQLIILPRHFDLIICRIYFVCNNVAAVCCWSSKRPKKKSSIKIRTREDDGEGKRKRRLECCTFNIVFIFLGSNFTPVATKLTKKKNVTTTTRQESPKKERRGETWDEKKWKKRRRRVELAHFVSCFPLCNLVRFCVFGTFLN